MPFFYHLSQFLSTWSQSACFTINQPSTLYPQNPSPPTRFFPNGQFLCIVQRPVTSMLSPQLVCGFSSFLAPNWWVNKSWRHSMVLGAKTSLKEGTLTIDGKEALTGVPHNIVVTPLTDTAAFVGAISSDSLDRHVFKLGVLEEVKLLSLYRFKLWWMVPRLGNSGSDIPAETQMLLLQVGDANNGAVSDKPTYIVFLPQLDGEFRSSLQGNSSNELEFCVESGDPGIVTSQSLNAVFVNYGNHPFDLMKESIKILEKHTGTFARRETKQASENLGLINANEFDPRKRKWFECLVKEKQNRLTYVVLVQMPQILDCFGWCTWDAFYHSVNPEGIKEGLKSLSEGGTPAKFLIIDDGWQDTTNEFQKEGEPFVDGTQFGGRLASIEENHKFRKGPSGLKDFVSDIKKTYGLKYVYVWHALMGYWGGLVPNAPKTEKYNPKLVYPVQSPGNLEHGGDISIVHMEKYGVYTIDPAKASEFYNDLHGYLVSQGVDGVKVDVQNILETIGAGLGGRVSLTKQFQEALQKSVITHFRDNGMISCMCQNTDSIYHAKTSGVARASDDYFPQNPATQTLHIAAVSFNSLFLGEFVAPDWDMFYSLHESAEFHAVARAVGGCGIYVSDKPGHHDFEILQRLVLADGSVLRAKYPGRPTRDCLFNDPVMDGKRYCHFPQVGCIFNCQGRGSWPERESSVQMDASFKLTGKVCPADVEYFEEVSGDLWTGDCAIFSYQTGSLSRMPMEESFDVTLEVLQCDVFTISPIKVYHENIEFAPIGLMNMYNAGGAVDGIELLGNSRVRVKGRGGGKFGTYSSAKPKDCSVNSEGVEFDFREEDGLLSVAVPAKTTSWDILICY